MKLKIFYLLLLICGISMISSAKQKACKAGSCCRSQKEEFAPQIKSAGKNGFDLSPLRHFVFNI